MDLQCVETFTNVIEQAREWLLALGDCILF